MKANCLKEKIKGSFYFIESTFSGNLIEVS